MTAIPKKEAPKITYEKLSPADKERVDALVILAIDFDIISGSCTNEAIGSAATARMQRIKELFKRDNEGHFKAENMIANMRAEVVSHGAYEDIKRVGNKFELPEKFKWLNEDMASLVKRAKQGMDSNTFDLRHIQTVSCPDYSERARLPSYLRSY